MQTCSKCKTTKDYSEFHKDSRTPSGYTRQCKECRNAFARAKPATEEQKQKHRQRENERRGNTKPRKCVQCGVEFQRPKNGHNVRCPACYPKYRKALASLKTIESRSRKKGTPCDLTIEWLLERYELPCPKTGVTYVMDGTGGYGERSPYCPSIDKIDPQKGYTQDNCQMVCWFYNCAKQQFTDEEVVELCRLVVKNHT